MAQSEIKKCFYEYSCVLDSPFKDYSCSNCEKFYVDKSVWKEENIWTLSIM